MLVFKEPEESTAHKVLYYGILFLIIVYMMKLIKYMISKTRTYYSRDGLRLRTNSPGGNRQDEIGKHRKRQRRKRHGRLTAADQWAKEKPCHLTDEEEEE
ncbi:unnamed protein product [Leptosia nina]|uniref:Uncharacterized protein n=1 Tax=Leptosia nina TaxID=320188 RepID=A0AAV1JRL9_9NEOP